MATIWYVSKYISLPSSGRWSSRGFMLMREMVRAGHECLMITSDSNHLTNVPELTGRSLTERVDGVDVCWVRTRKFAGAQSMGRILSWIDFEWRLWRLSKRDFPRPDAVIVSSLSLLTILNGLWLQFRYRCRLVFEIRDIWPLTIIEEGGFSRRNPFVIGLGLIERLGYRRADAIVGTMPNLEQHVAEQVTRHAPVHTVAFGVDPEAPEVAEPLPTGWIERFVPAGKFVVCHAGTIGTTNALDILFDCARAMRDQPDVHFLIVGDGDLRPGYENACADLSNVTFTGPVPKQMVQSVLAQADLLFFSVLVSKVWRYGMSLNKVIDYMMSGKPILGSYSGFPTMVEESGGGTMVPAGDMEALKAEIERYKRMKPEERALIGARGRAWLLTHRRYDRLAAEYLAIALPSERIKDAGEAAEPEVTDGDQARASRSISATSADCGAGSKA